MEAETGVESGLDVVVAAKSDEEDYAKTNSDSSVNNTYVNPAFVGEVKIITELPPSIISSVAPRVIENTVGINPDNTSDTNSETVKYVFGWCCITGSWLQIFNKPVTFLICLCMGGIAQGLVVSGIALSSLTSIEKQFGMKSTEVALFQTVYDTAYGIASLFIGFAGRAHKPRYLGWGLLIMVFGAVVASVPKFLVEKYTKGATRFDDYCNANGTSSTKAPGNIDSGNPTYDYQLIFNIGFIILGLGATPLYTLGPAHIDEVTPRGLSSIYLGVFYASCAIGPAIGFILAKPILEIWIELNEKPPLSLTDPNWVGAWWLGFLIGAGLLIIPVLPMLGLPRIFPNTEELNAKKRQIKDSIPEDKSLSKGWPAIKALLRNPPFIFISLGIAAESLAIGGFSTFIPKYVETQFNITPSTSALYVGVMGIPSAAGGVLLGGYCVKRFNWDCKDILKKASMLSFLAALFSAFILVGCHGHNVEIPASSRQTNHCNTACNCKETRYQPICTGNMSYYSPCHAGCMKTDRINDTYHNCSCFSLNVTEAKIGVCNSETCPLFPVFVMGIFLLVVFTFLNNVPLINATFRVVNEGQGAFAMGFQQIFVRFLGFIPSPILYGTFIDKSCRLWAEDPSSLAIIKTTNCLEYNKETFRYHMFIIALATKFIAFAFMFTAYKLYKLPSSKTVPEGSGVDNVTFSREQSTVTSS